MVSGRLGLDAGFSWPSETDEAIDADNDGQFGTPSKAYIDLSEALSVSLGRQVPQTAIFRVGFIEVGLRNKDDTDDNDNGAFFGGTFFFHPPTKHKVDALQLARRVEHAVESIQIDADSMLLATHSQYTGMRFNYDSDNQIHYATAENLSGLSGSQWDMGEVFTIYDAMKDSPTEKTNSLWLGRTGRQSKIGWAASISNWSQPNLIATAISGADKMMDIGIDNWKLGLPGDAHLDVLNGMLKMTVSHSNVDPSGFIDDDYEVQVTIGVYGWEAY